MNVPLPNAARTTGIIFGFIISPEDAAELGDLRTFTRELMTDVARDLGTKLDWITVHHWNTDNPHIHVLIRGRARTARIWSSAGSTSAAGSGSRRRTRHARTRAPQ